LRISKKLREEEEEGERHCALRIAKNEEGKEGEEEEEEERGKGIIIITFEC
jgi:hypothetical protein